MWEGVARRAGAVWRERRKWGEACAAISRVGTVVGERREAERRERRKSDMGERDAERAERLPRREI